jgi:hypothetical protein
VLARRPPIKQQTVEEVTVPDPTQRAHELRHLSRPLLTTVRLLEPVVIVGSVIGVVCGIIFARQATPGISLGILGKISLTDSHPYGSAGIAISVTSLLGGATMWAIARGLRIFLLDLSVRYEIEPT